MLIKIKVERRTQAPRPSNITRPSSSRMTRHNVLGTVLTPLNRMGRAEANFGGNEPVQ